jgi:Uma2 family endonuclease
MNSLNYSIKFGGRLDDRLFSRLCRENPDLRLERTSRGELVVMSPAGGESSERNFELCGQLRDWIRSTGLGRGFDSSAGFKLPNGAIVSPDASWIPNETSEKFGDPMPPPRNRLVMRESMNTLN